MLRPDLFDELPVPQKQGFVFRLQHEATTIWSHPSHSSFYVPKLAMLVLKPYTLIYLERLSLCFGHPPEHFLLLLVPGTFRHLGYIPSPVQGWEYSISYLTSIKELAWRRSFNSWSVPPFRVPSRLVRPAHGTAQRVANDVPGTWKIGCFIVVCTKF